MSGKTYLVADLVDLEGSEYEMVYKYLLKHVFDGDEDRLVDAIDDYCVPPRQPKKL